MDDCFCFMISIVEGDELFRVALRVTEDELRDIECEGDNTILYPMEPESRANFRKLLPDSAPQGPIVDVTDLFGIYE